MNSPGCDPSRAFLMLSIAFRRKSLPESPWSYDTLSSCTFLITPAFGHPQLTLKNGNHRTVVPINIADKYQRLDNSGAWKVSMCCLGLFFVLRLKTAETSGFQMYLLQKTMWCNQPQKRYLYPTCSLWMASQDCPRQREIKKCI